MHVFADEAYLGPVDDQALWIAGPAQRLHQRRAQRHAQLLGNQLVGRGYAQVLAGRGDLRWIISQRLSQRGALQLLLQLG